ncbi:MAG: protein-L-isoaspartate(D-aspartate) O-methyltransferase [Planctomycetota bacterium]
MKRHNNFRRLPLCLLASGVMLTAGCDRWVESGDTTKKESKPPPTEPAGEPQEPAKATRIEDWEPPEPPAAKERAAERQKMVRSQIAGPVDFRDPVTDKAVLDAMRTVPRHAFVPARQRPNAYQDSPLGIGYGQTISQPYIVACMTELLDLEPGDKVLEIGTGSGYQAAVLAQLTPNMYTIEIIEALADRAAGTLKAQGYKTVRTKHADGYHGWPEHAPYDAIIVTCAAGHIPPPLWKQLKPGGRLVAPIGGPYQAQRLILAEKTEDGRRRTRSVMAVRFVPLTRQSDHE